jgi:lysophospholipase L1-like esterase
MLVKKHDTQLDVRVMQYERYNTSFERFVKYYEEHNPELVFFQLRYYHFLRLVCLLSYYIDDNYNVRKDFNLPFFRPFSNEIYDPFLIYTIRPPAAENVKTEEKKNFAYQKLNNIYSFLREKKIIRSLKNSLNTCLGFIIGNYLFAIKEYTKMLKEIIKFSEQKKLPLIFLSPMPKPSPYPHYLVSKMLNTSMKKFIGSKGYDYVDLFSKYSDNGEYLFLDDDLHLNDSAHKFIASKLYSAVKKHLIRLREVGDNSGDTTLIEGKQK